MGTNNENGYLNISYLLQNGTEAIILVRFEQSDDIRNVYGFLVSTVFLNNNGIYDFKVIRVFIMTGLLLLTNYIYHFVKIFCNTRALIARRHF